jgi:hypothetical protein
MVDEVPGVFPTDTFFAWISAKDGIGGISNLADTEEGEGAIELEDEEEIETGGF